MGKPHLKTIDIHASLVFVLLSVNNQVEQF